MTDFQKFCLAFIAVVGIFLVGVFAFKFGRKEGYSRGYSDACAQAHTDTVTRVDTVIRDHPVPVTVWKDRLVYVPVPDSILVEKHDTTYIALQFEKKEYADSTYRAVVSGFQPSLDWIEVYQKTQIITKTIPDTRRWTFGLTAGPSVVWNPNGLHAGVGLTAGLQYRF